MNAEVVGHSFKMEMIVYQDSDKLADALRERFSEHGFRIESGQSNTGLSATRILSPSNNLQLIAKIEAVVAEYGMAEIEIKMIRYV